MIFQTFLCNFVACMVFMGCHDDLAIQRFEQIAVKISNLVQCFVGWFAGVCHCSQEEFKYYSSSLEPANHGVL
jgi:hypothetical protein